MCVYVNKHGNCGPHLDRKQMQHLPDHFGPGPVNSVLQQVVQSCTDCAYQPKVLLSALQSDSGGGEVVRGENTLPLIITCSFVGIDLKKKMSSNVFRRFWIKQSDVVFHPSENKRWRSCDQTTVSLQRFLCVALLGNDVPSSSV